MRVQVYQDFYIIGPDVVRNALYMHAFQQAGLRPKTAGYQPSVEHAPSETLVLVFLPAEPNARASWITHMRSLHPDVAVVVVDETEFDPKVLGSINLTLHISARTTTLADMVREVVNMFTKARAGVRSAIL